MLTRSSTNFCRDSTRPTPAATASMGKRYVSFTQCVCVCVCCLLHSLFLIDFTIIPMSFLKIFCDDQKKGGCCCVVTNKALIVAVFDENVGHTAAGCNAVVSDLAKHLKTLNF